MKTAALLLFFSLIFSSTIIKAQDASRNLFVEIDVNATDEEKVKFGRIAYEEDNTPSRFYFEGDDRRQMFLDSLSYDLSILPNDKKNTLLYIHGMWAYNWSFLKGNHETMQSKMWDNNANPNGMVVTVIWHCKVKYLENSEMAMKSGKILSPLVKQIHDITAQASDFSKTNYLIHSMGHRVFQSIWEGNLTEDMSYHAEHIIMAGSDLETNAFEEGEILGNIDYLSQDILLYVHNNDRTLGISKMINGEDRLGLQGIKNFDKVSDAIMQVDVSVINDNEDASSKFSNHRYFYTSPTVRKDIALFYQGISKDKIPRRKELDHPHRVMLEMPEDN